MSFRLRASLRTRFKAFGLDVLFCLIAGVFAYGLTCYLFAFISTKLGEDMNTLYPFCLIPLSLFVYVFFYMTERFLGASFGMRLCGLGVRSKLTGEKPVWAQDLVRSLEPIPIFLCFASAVLLLKGVVEAWVVVLLVSMGFVLAQLAIVVGDDRRESLFDKMSGTVVVYDRPPKILAKPTQTFPSPYVVGPPVSDAKIFFGRDEELRLIRDAIHKAQKGALIVLAGAPRSGKSSLIEYIVAQRDRLIQTDKFWERVMPVSASLLTMPVGGDVEFYLKLGEKLLGARSEGRGSEQAAPPKLDPSTLDYAAIDKAQRFFTEALQSALDSNPDKILLLMLDEAQLIERRVKEKRMTTGVVPYLAHLKDQNPRLCLVLAGPWDLKNQRFEFMDTLLKKATQHVLLGHLSYEAARRLVTEPVAGMISYTPEAVDYIIRLTGRHPFYTQLLCNSLVDLLGRRDNVTVDDIVPAAEAVAETPPAMLPIFWADATPVERAVLAALARVSFDEEDFASAKTVYRQMRRVQLGFALPAMHEVVTVLNDLVWRNILTVLSDRWYTFSVDLLRIWIRANRLTG